MLEPSTDFTYPDQEPEKQNSYREAARKFLRILNIQAAILIESESKEVTIWAMSYALGLAVCEGISISDRAAMLGITPQALSKRMDEFRQAAGLPSSPYGYNQRKKAVPRG